MPTDVQNKYYKANGIIQALPGIAENDARWQVATPDEVSADINKWSTGQYANDEWSKSYVAGLRSGLPNSDYALDDKGVLTTKTALAQQQQQQQDMASGKSMNVGSNAAPLTIPYGTAAATLSMSPKAYAAGYGGAGVPGFNPPGTPAQYPDQSVDPSQKFQTAFQAAKDAGTTSPTNSEGAFDMFKTFLPSQQSNQASSFFSQDPFLNTTISDYQQYMSQQSQQKSLTETYQKMLQDSGIQGIDTQLLNMRNVMNGTEDDIRNEITKAGGFGTESQVMALTNARNKQLIQNYNNLQATRDSKQQYLDTMMNLTEKDRAAASQAFDTKMNFDSKMYELSQQMKNNAIDSLNRTAKTIGWDGIFNATQGNTQLQAQIERAYGLPAGGLALAAQQDAQARAAQTQQSTMDAQYKQAQIDNLQAKTSTTTSSSSTSSSGGTGGTSTKSIFSQTQLNKGASNAGVPIADFSKLSDDSKNYYVNNYSQFQTILKNVEAGNEDVQTVINEINQSNQPADVKANLIKKLQPFLIQKLQTDEQQPSTTSTNWWNPLSWGEGIYNATH